MKPVRLQLSRRKGFNLQALSMATNGLPAVNVARPSKWGNPYRVLSENDPQSAVDRFRGLLKQRPSRLRHLVLAICSGRPGIGEYAVQQMKASLPTLRGKNLACWCALDQPCHADVLLELACSPGDAP